MPSPIFFLAALIAAIGASYSIVASILPKMLLLCLVACAAFATILALSRSSPPPPPRQLTPRRKVVMIRPDQSLLDSLPREVAPISISPPFSPLPVALPSSPLAAVVLSPPLPVVILSPPTSSSECEDVEMTDAEHVEEPVANKIALSRAGSFAAPESAATPRRTRARVPLPPLGVQTKDDLVVLAPSRLRPVTTKSILRRDTSNVSRTQKRITWKQTKEGHVLAKYRSFERVCGMAADRMKPVTKYACCPDVQMPARVFYSKANGMELFYRPDGIWDGSRPTKLRRRK